jgi:outer membrane protein OmpA-like peptidoglycan-associated protein
MRIPFKRVTKEPSGSPKKGQLKPLAFGNNNQITFKVPSAPAQPRSKSSKFLSLSRTLRSSARRTKVKGNWDAEKEDNVSRVRNLENFDPEEMKRRYADRMRILQNVRDKNMEASRTAYEAIADVRRKIRAVERTVDELIESARKANQAAAEIARRAAKVAARAWAMTYIVMWLMVKKERIKRAKKAAYDASVAAWNAAMRIQIAHEQMLPVLEWVHEEKAKIQMDQIQARVLELMQEENSGVNCDLLSVNLVRYEIKLLEQIQFEAGGAIIKQDSYSLLEQLITVKKCMAQTCGEIEVPNMHWRVEGHTAKSKKSTDGGIGTSNSRAKAVCQHLVKQGVASDTLHPEGKGCFAPPKDKTADPRRVEIHVVKEEDLERVRRASQIAMGEI